MGKNINIASSGDGGGRLTRCYEGTVSTEALTNGIKRGALIYLANHSCLSINANDGSIIGSFMV
jgi:hypothetical protein